MSLQAATRAQSRVARAGSRAPRSAWQVLRLPNGRVAGPATTLIVSAIVVLLRHGNFSSRHAAFWAGGMLVAAFSIASVLFADRARLPASTDGERRAARGSYSGSVFAGLALLWLLLPFLTGHEDGSGPASVNGSMLTSENFSRTLSLLIELYTPVVVFAVVLAHVTGEIDRLSRLYLTMSGMTTAAIQTAIVLTGHAPWLGAGRSRQLGALIPLPWHTLVELRTLSWVVSGTLLVLLLSRARVASTGRRPWQVWPAVVVPATPLVLWCATTLAHVTSHNAGAKLVMCLDYPAAAIAVWIAVTTRGWAVANVWRDIADDRALRSRLLHDGLEHRRQLEIDLHDGAQQRLLAIGLRLGSIERSSGDAATVEALRVVREELHTAMDELRSLADRLYPAVLTQAGLGPALEAVAERLPLDVRLIVPAARFAPDVENAAYCFLRQALLDASERQASGVIDVTVTALADELYVDIRSDVTKPDSHDGAAWSRMRDRLAAMGGFLKVHADAAHGTRLMAWIPCG